MVESLVDEREKVKTPPGLRVVVVGGGENKQKCRVRRKTSAMQEYLVSVVSLSCRLDGAGCLKMRGESNAGGDLKKKKEYRYQK